MLWVPQNKPFMLSVIMLSVVRLSVVAPQQQQRQQQFELQINLFSTIFFSPSQNKTCNGRNITGGWGNTNPPAPPPHPFCPPVQSFPLELSLFLSVRVSSDNTKTNAKLHHKIDCVNSPSNKNRAGVFKASYKFNTIILKPGGLIGI